jgi:hypothetical protein
MACPYSSSKRRGNLLLLVALMGWCDFVECCAALSTGPVLRESSTRHQLKEDEKGDLLDKNVGRNPPKATPLSPSSDPSVLATDQPTAAPQMSPHQSPTVRPVAQPSSLQPSVLPSLQGGSGTTANPFSKGPSNESQHNTPSRLSNNGAPMKAPSNAHPNSTLEASSTNAVPPSLATTTAAAASNRLNAPSLWLVWMIVAAGIALSVSASLLLLRRRHKFVQRTKTERKTTKRRHVIVELNDTMGSTLGNNDEDQHDSRWQMT